MKKYILLMAVAAFAAISCEKSFETDYSSRMTGSQAAEKVDQDPSFLSSYVSGFYSYMVQYNTQANSSTVHDDYGLLSVYNNLELMTADIVCAGTPNWGQNDYLQDYGQQEYRRTFQHWNFYYTMISNSNAVIDFFLAGEDPTDATARGYLGQAYILRAMAYTELLYQYVDPVDESGALNTEAPSVPLIFATRDGSSSLEEVKARLVRNPMSAVMKHIEDNIALALPLLEGYKRASKNEIDLQVAQGIAARYYLFSQQWEKAAEMAKAASAGYTLMDKARLHAGFNEINDAEVMWGFNHSTETQTTYASFFSHMCNDGTGYAGIGQMIKCIDKSLYDQIPDTDYRKTLFNTPAGDPAAAAKGAQYPYASRKFGWADQWLQDYIFMRAAEMKLIEAEAYTRLGRAADAVSVIKEFMAHRDPGFGKGSVTLEDVLLQRRIELWGEGFAYFDLRRNGLGCVRNYPESNHPEWARKDFAPHANTWRFQIPLREIQNNTEINDSDQNEW